MTKAQAVGLPFRDPPRPRRDIEFARRLTRRIAVAALAAALGCDAKTEGPTQKGPRPMTFAPHPGQITMVDLSTGSVRVVRSDDVPDRQRFVYLKDGVETEDANEATERVPIVEVQMMPVDEHGNLVHKDKASTIRIQEFGPGKRPLRSTTMLRQ